LLFYLSSFFYYSGAPRDLHSFPTRRSSDLGGSNGERGVSGAGSAAHRTRAASPCPRSGRRRSAEWRRAARPLGELRIRAAGGHLDRKSTRLNSSHVAISYAVFCLKKKKRGG